MSTRAVDRLQGFSVMKDSKTQKVTFLTWIKPSSCASNYSTNFFKKEKKVNQGEFYDKKKSLVALLNVLKITVVRLALCVPTLLFSILGFCEISLNI